MGEMADYFLDECIDFDDEIWGYFHGETSHDEAYAKGVIDESGIYQPAGRKRKPAMNKVPCKVEDVELENDRGLMVPGVIATCTKCDHKTESFGQTDRSIKRCLVLMKEECELGETNYYVDDSE